ncbi:MAG: DUF2470 domain-containing protein [Hydrogenophilales bacterium]|nr:DUF2470 domain-containing protein [Hydrogenophilales bacterium]
MTAELTPGQEARRLLRRHYYGVLSTTSQKFPGYPYGSFVDYVTDHQGRPVILISALAEHAHNIFQSPKVSLTVHDSGSQTQALPRLALLGEAKLIGPDDAHHIRARYLRYFPEAEPLLALDFALYRIEPHRIRYIAGFAQARWVSPSDFLALASQLTDTEEAILAHMNTGHADALAGYAGRDRSETIAMIGLDSDGFDLRIGEKLQRIEFDGFVADASAARERLVALASGK